jgi:hypothetical protein
MVPMIIVIVKVIIQQQQQQKQLKIEANQEENCFIKIE